MISRNIANTPSTLDVLPSVALPPMSSQIEDGSRTSLITYIKSNRSLGTATSQAEYANAKETLPEQRALKEFSDFMDSLGNDLPSHLRECVDGIRNNLVFLGAPELATAVGAMAGRLRHDLNSGHWDTIYIDAGMTQEQRNRKRLIKSGEYILSLVLGQLSNEEFDEYASRLSLHSGNDTITNDSKIVFIDDWAIFGSQMKERTGRFLNNNNTFQGDAEVWLAAASSQHLANGIEVDHDRDRRWPVEAYYKVDSDPDIGGRMRITGGHCSADHEFEYDLEYILCCLGRDDLTMPPLTNIVRPYRSGQDFPGRERLRQLQA